MSTHDELQAWLTGTVDGGPNADGRYPLTYADGLTYLVYCPAAQALNPALSEQPIEVFANTATAAAATATVEAAEAEQSSIDAQTYAANAAASATAANTAKVAAQTAKTAAELAETNAELAETNAESAATAAATSAGNAAASETAADASADAAAASAADAAASAAGKANDSEVVHNTGVETIAGGKTFTDATSIGNGSGVAQLFINALATSVGDLGWRSSGYLRWMFRRNTTAETGANVGSDLDIYGYSDTGSSTLFARWVRSTGILDFKYAPTINGVGLMKQAWNLIAGNGLTGGGDGSADRTITLGTPGTLSEDSTNAVTSTSHTHNVLLSYLYNTDNRTTPLRVDPADYTDRGLSVGFNGVANLGLPSGTYGMSLHLAPWTVYNASYRQNQLNFAGDGSGIYWRYATSDTTWSATYKVLTTADAIDAATLNGMSPSGASDSSTIVNRNGSGDIYARLFRSEYPDETAMSGAITFRKNNTTDNYDRHCSYPPSIRDWLGLGTAALDDSTINESASTLVKRDGGGFIHNSYFNTSAAFTAVAPTAVMVETGSDGYIRKQTVADFKTNLALDSTNVPMNSGVVNATATLGPTRLNTVVEKSNTTAYTYTIATTTGGVAGDAITFMNSGTAGNLTIAQGTSITIVRNGVTGNVTVAPGSVVTLVRSATANKWVG